MYTPPKPKYRGPRTPRLGTETRRQRKRRSALAASSFRSRVREKDPYQLHSGDPYGLMARMGPVRPVVIVL
jgi:hypothetical protein